MAYTPCAVIDAADAATRTTGERHYFGTIAAWAGGTAHGPVASDPDRVYAVFSDAELAGNATFEDNFRDHGYAAWEEDGSHVYVSWTQPPTER